MMKLYYAIVELYYALLRFKKFFCVSFSVRLAHPLGSIREHAFAVIDIRSLCFYLIGQNVDDDDATDERQTVTWRRRETKRNGERERERNDKKL